MMTSVLRKYNIPYKGLAVGSHAFDFEVDDAFFACFSSSEIERGNAKIHVDLQRQNNMLVAQIDIEGDVIVPCDRCLEDVELPIFYQAELIVQFSEQEMESDGDIMWLHPADDELPLAQYIYESIYLSLPYNRVHYTDENGVSECNPDMLARFEQEQE
ncbi:MAG: DUF177 domain-containing protein [Rikenellaceae bacterium]